MRHLVPLFFATLLALPSHAQEATRREWSLQQCISHALAHNLNIQLHEDNAEQQEIALSTSRNARLPNLSGSAGENFSFGRALTMDNTYANHNTQVSVSPPVCR